jgi:hypothetical protein
MPHLTLLFLVQLPHSINCNTSLGFNLRSQFSSTDQNFVTLNLISEFNSNSSMANLTIKSPLWATIGGFVLRVGFIEHQQIKSSCINNSSQITTALTKYSLSACFNHSSGDGFQRRTFPFIRGFKLSPCLRSSFRSTNFQEQPFNFNRLLVRTAQKTQLSTVLLL